MILVFKTGMAYLRVKIGDDRLLWLSGPMQGENQYLSLEELADKTKVSSGESEMTALIVRSLPTMADVKNYCILEFKRQGFAFVKEL